VLAGFLFAENKRWHAGSGEDGPAVTISLSVRCEEVFATHGRLSIRHEEVLATDGRLSTRYKEVFTSADTQDRARTVPQSRFLLLAVFLLAMKRVWPLLAVFLFAVKR